MRRRLDAADYLADLGLATALFCAAGMPQPLLVEGEAGVGKTEAAKALARVLDTPLVRLQCYEGIDAAEALYEWNYPRQLLGIRLAEATGPRARRGRPVRPRLPRRAAAAAGHRHPGPRPVGAAGRRGGPGRRRVRGVPAGAAGRVGGHHPRAGDHAGPCARPWSSSRPTAPATCTTPSSVAASTTGSTTPTLDRAVAVIRRRVPAASSHAGRAGGGGGPAAADPRRAEAAGPGRGHQLGGDARAAGPRPARRGGRRPTLGTVLKYREDLDLARKRGTEWVAGTE